MRRLALQSLLCSSLLLIASGAIAETPASGTFVAHQSCPAVQSIRTGANPGNVSVEPSGRYSIFAKNKPDATHYLIDVPDAHPARRWVAVGCGEATLAEGGGQPGADGGQGRGGEQEQEGGQAAQKPDYILAVSWQPAFCEAKPDKVECETQRPDRFDATHFTLHGLWPKKQYCKVDRHIIAADKDDRWNGLPEPELTDATRNALSEVMPGVMSLLERHEWIKHGTCFPGGEADAYFARALALMSQLNASKVQELFSSHIGEEITRDQLKAAFNETFGDGAADRVRVACKRDAGRNLIVEMTIGLNGDIKPDSKLAELIAAAPTTDPGCPRGVVDQVGLQ
ncbi:ribonuclease T [Methylocystis sp. B8]|uniref:ribonuclease T2 family protein n=1 Tax=Methylocystis sp. B8 TaxID=544938 RepID=UPI0010FD2426|nr:ribonuclease T [Methylocystis sp. B8]TLG78496.1 ribonuclease T [Methylocystis sp. B8]